MWQQNEICIGGNGWMWQQNEICIGGNEWMWKQNELSVDWNGCMWQQNEICIGGNGWMWQQNEIYIGGNKCFYLFLIFTSSERNQTRFELSGDLSIFLCDGDCVAPPAWK